jgi:predicted nuclease of predicted toxin-antitoxin system
VKFKLDENLPASSSAILANAGHDVDTVADEELTGAPDQDVVAAATEAGRILISWTAGWATSALTRPAVMPASSCSV